MAVEGLRKASGGPHRARYRRKAADLNGQNGGSVVTREIGAEFRESAGQKGEKAEAVGT